MFDSHQFIMFFQQGDPFAHVLYTHTTSHSSQEIFRYITSHLCMIIQYTNTLQHQPSRMNLANKLTISRVLAIPFLVFFLSVKEDSASPMLVAISYWLATITIVFATITDYYDGKIARKLGLESSFGKLMDPLADKLIVMAGFIACMSITRPHTSTPLISGWFVIIILAREFLLQVFVRLPWKKGL